jgi:hypothetical protein
MARRKNKQSKKTKSLTVPSALTEGGASLAAMRAQYEAEMLATAEQQAALEREEKERKERADKSNANQNKLAQRLLAKETRSHRIAVDFGGGLIAQVSTELINYFVRLAGEWSHDGWTAKNVDLLQGAPHLIFGSAMYFGDMLLRKNGKPPSMPREVFSEFAKLFSQLGFSNLVRAARVRYNDGKRKAGDYDALVAENAEIKRKYQALKPDGDGEGNHERG